MPAQAPPSAHHQRLFSGTVLWLLVGCLALVTTLVPAHTELLGWAPVFWLLGAPLIVLLALEPRAPRQLLMRRRLERLRTIHGVVWR